MKDVLFAVLALVFAIAAAFFFYSFQSNEQAGTVYMVLGALFLVLTVVCGVMFLSKRVNKSEDIHITE
jgi:multidrug transporter EmrE-like cation transporter